MAELQFGQHRIGKGFPAYVIAEAGVNHNGDVGIAIRLVDAAIEAGADCVKFQTFTATNLVTKQAPKADYQLKVTDQTESQFDMLKHLELTLDDYRKLIEYCQKRKITFLSTPYNFEDVDFLEKLDVVAYKIASGQLVETPFLKYVAKKNKPMILSTGMGYLSDVDTAVRSFRETCNNQYALLQCVTNYPASSRDSNILAMKTMGDIFDCVVGYSDHTQNDLSVLAAVALGAKVIEKHLTLDKNMPGPDHSSSANTEEMKDLITRVRELEMCLGSGIKSPTEEEIANSKGMRRSLVLSKDCGKGHILSAADIGFRRPASGVPVSLYESFVGRPMLDNQKKDTLLTLGMVKW